MVTSFFVRSFYIFIFYAIDAFDEHSFTARCVRRATENSENAIRQKMQRWKMQEYRLYGKPKRDYTVKQP